MPAKGSRGHVDTFSTLLYYADMKRLLIVCTVAMMITGARAVSIAEAPFGYSSDILRYWLASWGGPIQETKENIYTVDFYGLQAELFPLFSDQNLYSLLLIFKDLSYERCKSLIKYGADNLYNKSDLYTETFPTYKHGNTLISVYLPKSINSINFCTLALGNPSATQRGLKF